MNRAPRGWAWLEYRRFEVDIGEVWCVRWYDAEQSLRMIDMRTGLRLLPPCRNRSSNERSSTTMLTSRKGRFGRHV